MHALSFTVGSAGIGRSLHFALHNFVPILVPSMYVCTGSMRLMALLCEVFMPVVKGHIFIFHSGEDLFTAAYVDGNFDEKYARVEGCFKIRQMRGGLGSRFVLQ